MTPPQDLLTGFLMREDLARGRLMGVALNSHGAFLVADHFNDTAWRVLSD